jgi:hypothetical protein
MERRRRKVLLSGLVAFCVWQIAMLASEAVPALASPVWRLLLVMASLSGGVFWFVNTLQMSRFQKEVEQNAAVSQALSDELTVYNRNKAVAAAFAAVMVTQVAIILLSLFVTLRASSVAQLTILVGVAAMTGAFLLFDRE